MLMVRLPDMLIFMQSTRDIATALWYTGVDPFTKQEVYVAKSLRDRKMQRALMQFFKPENWFTLREALIQDQVAPLRPLDRRPEIRVVPGIDDPTAFDARRVRIRQDFLEFRHQRALELLL